MNYSQGIAIGLFAAIGLAALGGQGVASARTAITVGSRNVALAGPSLPRPATRPCVVQLFAPQPFGKQGDGSRMDTAPLRFRYRPPAACKGPWAKVVLEASFSVGAGYQYDRSASIWLEGVNLYFGTTQEPTPEVAASWQIQRDLTDYSSLFRTAGSGQVAINNWLDTLRASPIHAGAKLLFYPANAAYPAPRVPDRVYALNTAATMPAKLQGPGAELARNIVFPRNTTRVYLDLFAQPQAHDEFYYMCLPDAVIARIGRPGSNGSIDRAQVCGGGSFREVEVTIDGKPAGLAPVAPWVFTGGIDPFLWQPTPGIQTLNFLPWRVDLTPFAGLLNDGQAHQVAIKILGTPHYFAVAGAILAYTDASSARVPGAVTRNTLQGTNAVPAISSTLAPSAHGVHGDVLTRADQHYVIEGYVDTPAGRVQSRVDTTIDFGNTQQFAPSTTAGRSHSTLQTASIDTTSSRTDSHAKTQSRHRHTDYTLAVRTRIRADGKQRQRDVQLRQAFHSHVLERQPGLPFYASDTRSTHLGSDRLSYTEGDRKSFTSHAQTSTQDSRFTNSLGDCYQAQVQARDGKVTGYGHGQGCLNPDAMHWFVRPDGSPDSFGWRAHSHHQARQPSDVGLNGASRPTPVGTSASL